MLCCDSLAHLLYYFLSVQTGNSYSKVVDWLEACVSFILHRFNDKVRHIKILTKDGCFYIAESRLFKTVLVMVLTLYGFLCPFNSCSINEYNHFNITLLLQNSLEINPYMHVDIFIYECVYLGLMFVCAPRRQQVHGVSNCLWYCGAVAKIIMFLTLMLILETDRSKNTVPALIRNTLWLLLYC